MTEARRLGRNYSGRGVKRSTAWLGVVVGVAVITLAGALPVSAMSLAARVRSVQTQEKIIALTFDDGWSAGRARAIVRILDHYRVSATFFPYADAVVQASTTWREIAKRFPIGNHTITHPNLNRLSAAQVFAEIDGARRLVEGATGRPMIPVFRPPYMAYNDQVREQAFRAGFPTMVLWTVDSEDGVGRSEQRVFQRAIKGEPGEIVLLHAGPPATVAALPRIIEWYRAQGYRFVTIPQMLGIPWRPSVDTVPPTGPRPGFGEPTPAQLIWTGPVYIRPSAAHRSVPD